MLRRSYLITAVMVSALALAAAGCGSGNRAAPKSSKHPAKHTLLPQVSLAIGAFHEFIWIPARANQLSDPLSPAASQGAAAALFAARELKIAARQAQRQKRLQTLSAPFELTADKLTSLGTALPQHASLVQIDSLNGILNRIAAMAIGDGFRIVSATRDQVAAAGGPHA